MLATCCPSTSTPSFSSPSSCLFFFFLLQYANAKCQQAKQSSKRPLEMKWAKLGAHFFFYFFLHICLSRWPLCLLSQCHAHAHPLLVLCHAPLPAVVNLCRSWTFATHCLKRSWKFCKHLSRCAWMHSKAHESFMNRWDELEMFTKCCCRGSRMLLVLCSFLFSLVITFEHPLSLGVSLCSGQRLLTTARSGNTVSLYEYGTPC